MPTMWWVTVTHAAKQAQTKVQDNGYGVPENAERSNHYGMIIMRDRAQSLRGDCRTPTRLAEQRSLLLLFQKQPETRGDTHE